MKFGKMGRSYFGVLGYYRLSLWLLSTHRRKFNALFPWEILPTWGDNSRVHGQNWLCILGEGELSTLLTIYIHELHHAEVSMCDIYLIKSTKGKFIRLWSIAIIKILLEMTISIG